MPRSLRHKKSAEVLEEDRQLMLLLEEERALEEAHRKLRRLPAELARAKHEAEITMPPMAVIVERERVRRFEEALSRGEIENVLRTQRRSIALMLLLAATATALFSWAARLAGMF